MELGWMRANGKPLLGRPPLIGRPSSHEPLLPIIVCSGDSLSMWGSESAVDCDSE
jgi:hypothetical protein